MFSPIKLIRFKIVQVFFSLVLSHFYQLPLLCLHLDLSFFLYDLRLLSPWVYK